jgi:hypothetical protein
LRGSMVELQKDVEKARVDIRLIHGNPHGNKSRGMYKAVSAALFYGTSP